MTEAAQSGSSLELCKQTILAIIGEISQALKVDIRPLSFKWDFDSELSHWLLLVYNGKKRHVLRVEESDFEAWPAMPEIAGKYIRKIIFIVACVERNQHREAGTGG